MPTLSISPSGLTIYNTWIGPKRYYGDEIERERKLRDRDHNLRNNSHNGTLSAKAIKRVECAMKWLLFMSREKKIYYRAIKKYVKFKITFVTVTLASEQKHTDQVIKSKLLNQLLTELRQRYDMKHYVWRAEKQRNGNIHFHIVTNVFIPQDALCSMWNRIQEKLGYVSRYSEKMRESVRSFSDYYNTFIGSGTYSQLMQRYIKGRSCNWRNPNSTDIHSVKKVKNVAAYLMKYFTKNTQETAAKDEDKQENTCVNGKIWGLSESLTQMRSITTGIDYELGNELGRIIDVKGRSIYNGRFFTFIRIDFKQLIKMKATHVMTNVFRFLESVGEKTLGLC